MSIVKRVRRAAAMMKPKHGEPCNRCGVCCEVALCPLAAHVFKLPEHFGPCPALSGEPGETSCGLVSHPQHWMPVRTIVEGVEPMRESALLLINAADGCDARINGEPRNAAFNERLLQLDKVRKKEIAEAKRRWNQN